MSGYLLVMIVMALAIVAVVIATVGDNTTDAERSHDRAEPENDPLNARHQ